MNKGVSTPQAPLRLSIENDSISHAVVPDIGIAVFTFEEQPVIFSTNYLLGQVFWDGQRIAIATNCNEVLVENIFKGRWRLSIDISPAQSQQFITVVYMSFSISHGCSLLGYFRTYYVLKASSQWILQEI